MRQGGFKVKICLGGKSKTYPPLQKLDKELEQALAKMESEQNAAIGGLDEKVGIYIYAIAPSLFHRAQDIPMVYTEQSLASLSFLLLWLCERRCTFVNALT